MPRGDRTGPYGMGPMTGRGAGYCGGYDAPGYARPDPGYGYGMGGGRGRGHHWRHWYHATGVPGWARFGAAPGWGPCAAPAPEQQADALKNQAQFLKEQLDAITKRIEELQKGDEPQIAAAWLWPHGGQRGKRRGHVAPPFLLFRLVRSIC